MRRIQGAEAGRAKKEGKTWPSGPERTLFWLCPRSVLILVCWLSLIPISVFAADLVNINTAGSAELQTLNGIGEVKAQAIIDYRTQNGPFRTIEEIMNVNGIGQATFDKIKDHITVGNAEGTQPQTQTPTEAATSSPQTQAGGGSEIPPLTAQITAPAHSLAGAGSYFSGEAFGTTGEPVANARYLWNFGDGVSAEGQKVLHTYAYPGTYVLILTVASGYSTGRATLSLPVVAPQVSLVSEDDQSLLVANGSEVPLDIGFWQLTCPQASFLIPEQTTLLAQGGVRFSPTVTGLTCGTGAWLVYPSGTVAAQAHLSTDSSLHGEQVLPTELAKSSSAAPAAALSAAAADAPEPQPESAAARTPWLEEVAAAMSGGLGWLTALAALVLVGAAGVFVLQGTRGTAVVKEETKGASDEFDIIEN